MSGGILDDDEFWSRMVDKLVGSPDVNPVTGHREPTAMGIFGPAVDDTEARLRARVRELTDDVTTSRRIIADGHAAAVRDVTAENERLRAHLRHITLASRGKGAALARQALYGAPAPSVSRRERTK